MNPVFADSFYYIALLNRNDAAHKHAVELAHSLRPPSAQHIDVSAKNALYMAARDAGSL